jgi:hypothetical protein
MEHHRQIGFRIAEAVDRRNRRDDDRVRALEQRLGRGQAHLLDVLVDRGIRLDVGVGGRNVGFRLIVVVVGDEILHRAVRKNSQVADHNCAASVLLCASTSVGAAVPE